MEKNLNTTGFSQKQMDLLKKLEHLLTELEANDVFLVHQTEQGCLSAFNVADYNEYSVLYDTNEIPNGATDITDTMYAVEGYIPHQYESCDKVLGGWSEDIV